jgi:hypothetical protein
VFGKRDVQQEHGAGWLKEVILLQFSGPALHQYLRDAADGSESLASEAKRLNLLQIAG